MEEANQARAEGNRALEATAELLPWEAEVVVGCLAALQRAVAAVGSAPWMGPPSTAHSQTKVVNRMEAKASGMMEGVMEVVLVVVVGEAAEVLLEVMALVGAVVVVVHRRMVVGAAVRRPREGVEAVEALR